MLGRSVGREVAGSPYGGLYLLIIDFNYGKPPNAYKYVLLQNIRRLVRIMSFIAAED